MHWIVLALIACPTAGWAVIRGFYTLFTIILLTLFLLYILIVFDPSQVPENQVEIHINTWDNNLIQGSVNNHSQHFIEKLIIKVFAYDCKENISYQDVSEDTCKLKDCEDVFLDNTRIPINDTAEFIINSFYSEPNLIYKTEIKSITSNKFYGYSQ